MKIETDVKRMYFNVIIIVFFNLGAKKESGMIIMKI
jgi:hypothetical protein